MPSLRFLLSPTFVCFLGACSFAPQETGNASANGSPGSSNSGAAHAGTAGAIGQGQGKGTVSKGGGAAGHAGAKQSTGNSDETSNQTHEGTGPEGTDPSDSGEDAAAGDGAGASAGTGSGSGTGTGTGPITDPGPPADVGPPPTPCDLNGNCTSLECKATGVTCGVEFTGFGCELEGFSGATVPLACGERVVVGTACCGACGCVPVEVYFDGRDCWQGIPQCTLPEFNGVLFHPHATTTPNTSFVPPASFYLGSGGIPGRDASAGSAGTGGASGGSSGSAGSSGSVGSAAGGAAGTAGFAPQGGAGAPQ